MFINLGFSSLPVSLRPSFLPSFPSSLPPFLPPSLLLPSFVPKPKKRGTKTKDFFCLFTFSCLFAEVFLFTYGAHFSHYPTPWKGPPTGTGLDSGMFLQANFVCWKRSHMLCRCCGKRLATRMLPRIPLQTLKKVASKTGLHKWTNVCWDILQASLHVFASVSPVFAPGP